jgi:class 3 adenylate cyclase
MPLVVHVDRHKCIGAGNCITLAPTAFDWLKGDFGKADVIGTDTVEDDLLQEAAFACPTAAIVIEQVTELLPWQLRGRAEPKRRVLKTFMFTDVVGSTNLVEVMGDEAWDTLLRWHDATLREVFSAHQGKEISTTGDGFFVGFDSPEQAVAAAVAIQRRLAEQRQKAGFAPPIRIGIHAADANQVGENFRGRGVHEASRIASIAGGNEIVASVATAGDAYPTSAPRQEVLKGFSEPVEVVTIDWR